MKKVYVKILTIIIITTFTVLTSNAQEFGVRFGGINGVGGASIDAVFGNREYSRIHADLGFYKNNIALDVLWDFINRPVGGEALNWYMGVGPSLYFGHHSWLGVSGELGLEYRFNVVPIAVGVDWRPTFWLVKNSGFGADSFGFNIRLVF